VARINTAISQRTNLYPATGSQLSEYRVRYVTRPKWSIPSAEKSTTHTYRAGLYADQYGQRRFQHRPPVTHLPNTGFRSVGINLNSKCRLRESTSSGRQRANGRGCIWLSTSEIVSFSDVIPVSITKKTEPGSLTAQHAPSDFRRAKT